MRKKSGRPANGWPVKECGDGGASVCIKRLEHTPCSTPTKQCSVPKIIHGGVPRKNTERVVTMKGLQNTIRVDNIYNHKCNVKSVINVQLSFIEYPNHSKESCTL